MFTSYICALQFVGKRGDEQLLVLSEQKQLLQQEVDMLKEEVRELKAAEGKVK